jgi:hypothetical protein
MVLTGATQAARAALAAEAAAERAQELLVLATRHLQPPRRVQTEALGFLVLLMAVEAAAAVRLLLAQMVSLEAEARAATERHPALVARLLLMRAAAEETERREMPMAGQAAAVMQETPPLLEQPTQAAAVVEAVQLPA